jgi:hypothetical protein
VKFEGVLYTDALLITVINLGSDGQTDKPILNYCCALHNVIQVSHHPIFVKYETKLTMVLYYNVEKSSLQNLNSFNAVFLIIGVKYLEIESINPIRIWSG